MRSFSTAIRLMVCTLIAGAVPTLASAQSAPTTEFFAGYSLLRDPSQSVLAATARDQNLPLGWAAGAARPAWRWLSAVVDASGHYKHGTTFDDDVRLSFHAVTGGTRASAKIARLTEFAQVLGGIAHARGSAFGQTVATTALVLQGGGGVDYPVSSHVAGRLQLDYRWIKGDDNGRLSAHQLRALAAIVLR